MSTFTTRILAGLFVAGLLIGFGADRAINKTQAPSASSNCSSGLHYSYFSSKSFFEEAYKNAPATDIGKKDIKGAIVNHHLLAPHLIAATMETVATEDKVTVVLVSPNHFDRGRGGIISSVYGWETPYGILSPDCETIAELKRRGVVSVEEIPFKKEHGISGVVSFIKKSLPNAFIVPVIVKDSLSQKELDDFVQALGDILGNKALVVGSFDFSHYLPDAEAQFHDDKSLSILRNFDYAGLKALDTDSPRGLEIVLKYLEKEGAQSFDLIANTNSAQILGDPSIEETTSYIDGVFSVGAKAEDSTATILAFGDMMLDRMVRQKIERFGPAYPFEPIKRFLIGSDVVVANAEGAFTLNPSETVNNPEGPLKFTFDPAVLLTLKKLGFTLFSLANNHSLNFGEVGLDQSREAISSAGLGWFGDPQNRDTETYITSVRGEKLVFVGYHQFAGEGLTRALASIAAAKKSGAFVIVYPHWGIEYAPEASHTQIETAHTFVDAGADLVLGSHPHVIQPMEVYKDRAIFYSLGNFIFDQSSSGPTSKGLSVGISLSASKVSYYLFPLDIQRQQASLMPYRERVTLLNDFAGTSMVPPRLKASLKNGIFDLKRI